MKTSHVIKNVMGTLLLGLLITPCANAQIWKKLQKSAERTVERKLERKTEKETGKMMDSILDPSQKTSTNKNSSKTTNNTTTTTSSTTSTSNSSPPVSSDNSNKNVSDDLKVYSKFDYVPGDKVLFYDDFSQEFIGDFPSKWNTNGSGEVVKINDAQWFELKSGGNLVYIPDLKDLPEDYTIEFDILTEGLTDKTSSSAYLQMYLSDNKNLSRDGDNNVYTSIPLCQYSANALHSSNRFNAKSGGVNSHISADIRKEILNQPHIAVAVTKNRFRLWVNERKHIDIPRMVEVPNILNTVKFLAVGLKPEEHLYIGNLRIAEGGEDLRRKLLSEGKISTNGILFNSGSADIKPQSMGIVLQISQVLQQDNTIKLNIVGHTDADGKSEANLKLSKERARAVKEALVNLYNISADRLQTDGKGASTPVADNTSADGKAQNRRVEFIKI